MKAPRSVYLLLALVFCVSISGCKKEPSADDEKTLSSETQQEKPIITNQSSVKVEPVDELVEKETPVSIEEPIIPLDLTLDDKTVETIRGEASKIDEAPQQLPDLFEKEEKRVKINSRVIVDEETEALSEAAGAELNLELKVN